MNISLPELALVVLIGPESPAKRAFVKTHFAGDEVYEPDLPILQARLEAGKLSVVDAANESVHDRAPFHTLARSEYVEPVAIVFDLSSKVRDSARTQQLARRLKALDKEGFHRTWLIESDAMAASAMVRREPLPQRRPELTGPFDIIGDIHGCYDELDELLNWLGYLPASSASGSSVYRHPQGRKLIFLGDLVDRGPRVIDVLNLVMSMAGEGHLCVPGNHDVKLARKLKGHDVLVAHGLQASLDQIASLPIARRDSFTHQYCEFIGSLPHHYLLDSGKLVVAHGGMKEPMQGRAGGHAREFALFGDTRGEIDAYGLPVRHNWAEGYSGQALVVYGHTAIKEPAWLNNTVCIDTGCVFGGKLTALRYPERELVQVKAHKVHFPSRKPLG